VPFRRRRIVPVVRRRRLRRVLTMGAAAAGVVAWRERQLARNAERHGPPSS
jgi:hypothetical protein